MHHAKRELAAKAQAQIAADSMSGQLNHLRSEMTEFLKNHQTQSSNMSRLERDNAELRNRLAEATAKTGRNFLCASQCPTTHETGNSSVPWNAMPPGMRGIYDGGGGSPDDDDPGDHKKKKRDSPNFSSFAEDAEEGV